MFQHIGFIGVGNMGGALAKAAAKSAGGNALLLANRTPAKAEALAAQLGARTATNEQIARECDLIFLGVKPQMMPDMAAAIAPVLAARTSRFVLCSMAAGLDIARIQALCGGAYPTIRIMPNTPVAVGAGIIQFCTQGVTADEAADFKTLMQYAGLVDEIPETLCNAAGALSGCGPAFVALFAEALADGGVACGLPRAQALAYAIKTIEGTAQMMLVTGQHPAMAKDAVCSPGGTTIQGVRTLEEAGFRAAAMDAVIAAYDKTVSIGKK